MTKVVIIISIICLSASGALPPWKEEDVRKQREKENKELIQKSSTIFKARLLEHYNFSMFGNTYHTVNIQVTNLIKNTSSFPITEEIKFVYTTKYNSSNVLGLKLYNPLVVEEQNTYIFYLNIDESGRVELAAREHSIIKIEE